MLFMTLGDVEAFVSFIRVTTTTSPLCGFQKGFGWRKWNLSNVLMGLEFLPSQSLNL